MLFSNRLTNLMPGVDLAVCDVRRPDGSAIEVYQCSPTGKSPGRRPVMVLLHGSGASSVFPRIDEAFAVPFLFSAIRRVLDAWNVLLVEKRGVRLGDAVGGGLEGCGQEYLEHATRQDRTADVSLVIDEIAASDLHDGSTLLVIGSSEGAAVAAAVAADNANVTNVGLFGLGAGHGLFDSLMALRGEWERSDLSAEEFVEQYDWLVRTFREMREDPDSTTKAFYGHTYRRWASYWLRPVLEDLLAIEVPVFLGIATLDNPVATDWLVAEFVRAGKTNLTYRNYMGYDHGYFKQDDGSAECRHDEVLSDVLAWVGQAGLK